MKANFSISIVRDQQHSAVSNMDILENTTLPGGLVRVQFRTSVKMSSYLVAFVVSNFKHTESYTSGTNGCRKVRVCKVETEHMYVFIHVCLFLYVYLCVYKLVCVCLRVPRFCMSFVATLTVHYMVEHV